MNIPKGIYKITNNINGKCYIGKSNNIDRRFRDHKRLAFTEGHKEYDKALYQAFRKYGLENFTFEIIEFIEDENDYENISGNREKYWIEFYDSYNNGYNESLGGDGGSSKGHCQGSANGRSLLTEEDVIFIRTKFKEGCGKAECYKYFEDKISFGGFGKVWLGYTWSHIMPEVFTKENIKRNATRGRSCSEAHLHQRLLSDDEVRQIRQWRKEKITYKEIQKRLNNKVSLSTLKDIGNYRTYKEVI